MDSVLSSTALGTLVFTAAVAAVLVGQFLALPSRAADPRLDEYRGSHRRSGSAPGLLLRAVARPTRDEDGITYGRPRIAALVGAVVGPESGLLPKVMALAVVDMVAAAALVIGRFAVFAS